MTIRPALTLSERIELQAGLRAGESQAAMARRLGRSASVICGELKRNGGADAYQAEAADSRARQRRGAARRGRCRIDECPPLKAEVQARLHRGWSPEEVAGRLRRDHPNLPAMHTSHESIYRYVYIVARGALKRELVACLRRRHATRRPLRRGVTCTQGQLQDMELVDQRPPEIAARLIPGHYEGDLILGAGNRSAVGVLVERTTGIPSFATCRRRTPPACARPLSGSSRPCRAPCANHSPITKARRWRSTPRWRPTCS